MNVLNILLPCILLVMFPSTNNAVAVGIVNVIFGPLMAAIMCQFFNDYELCQSQRTIGNVGDISDAAKNVIKLAQKRSCTPYDCSDEPEIAPINLCIAIQKSCTVNNNDVKWAYEHAKGLIKNIDNAGFISTVIYSDEGEVQHKLRREPDTKLKSLNKPFKKFKPPRNPECEDCKANTKSAIQKCWDEFNRTKNTLQDVMIIYTDGVSFDTRFNLAEERQITIEHAEGNRARNIQTFVIKYKNPNGPIKGDFEWRALNNPGALADLPHPEPMSLTKNFKATDFLKDVCGSIPDCTPKPPSCGEIDLVLIIDRSNSITVPNIKRTIKFLGSMVKNLQVDSAHIRVGIISYNQIVYVHSDVNEALSKKDVLARIATIPTSNALATHTHEALAKAREMLNNSSRRGTAKQVIVVATDGQTWLLKDNVGGYAAKHNSPITVEEARRAKEEGAELFTIGLPNRGGAIRGREEEWIPMSSDPYECHFIDMTEPDVTFDDLVFARFHILTQLCIFEEGECQYVADEEEIERRAGEALEEGSGEI
ncbi:unnamed protein product [Owenia fusiformis]|uniref:Uncharacterized protein n=1 Tax=Owenia fusiformis TaxID=6347 RepID=A0A8J1TU24_OWEFU|nr:unnamed protein product [Owenia fusiformis]